MAPKLFQPNIGAMTLYAYQLLGMRPTSLIQEHIESARMATNMLMARWSAQGVNLWEIDLFRIPLKKGDGEYFLPDDIVGLLDCYITQPNGIDRIMMSISRTEYASYPNKEQQGFPTVFWFNQQLNSTINIWPTPPDDTLVLNGYYMKQIPDIGMQGSSYPEIPLYFQEAFAYGLAARLAMIWVPEKAQMLSAMAEESYQIASEQNIEDAATYVSPQVSGYWRI
jgi:hypothetical protein